MFLIVVHLVRTVGVFERFHHPTPKGGKSQPKLSELSVCSRRPVTYLGINPIRFPPIFHLHLLPVICCWHPYTT